MKRLLIPIIVGLVVSLTACKTTEENYRAAYEKAVTKKETSSGVDSTIYSRIRREATMAVLTVGSDSLPLRTEYIGYTKDGGASRETVKRYNVVAGQFKQLFNAMQMRKRLAADGYQGAYVLNTREPLYYVCILSTNVADSAAIAFRKISSDPHLRLIPPAPFVLRPAHLAR